MLNHQNIDSEQIFDPFIFHQMVFEFLYGVFKLKYTNLFITKYKDSTHFPLLLNQIS